MDDPAPRTYADEHHADRVDRTLRELQRMVKEHENALNLLRSDNVIAIADHNQAYKASLDVTTTAYKAVAETKPLLPSSDSVLPALLALRKTHQVTVESGVYATSQEVSLDKTKRQLEAEKADLEDQKALQAALERRIKTLKSGLESKEKKTPQQVAAERLDELRKEKRNFNQETKKLLRSLNNFIDNHLGAMVAAEELGGPVVGDLMDVDVEELEAGFNTQGKAKKRKGVMDEDVRQRRIDEIWGGKAGQEPAQDKQDRELDEATAAGADLRELTEQLLNSLTESQGDTSASYVKIPRETAAARFLVRSKVAQFHPKDATRLRLIDFGRELDDDVKA